MNILSTIFVQRVPNKYFSEMTGMQHLTFFTLLLRPWDLSHRVERQKLVAIGWEVMSVRVRKGGFMADLLLGQNLSPSFVFRAYQSIIMFRAWGSPGCYWSPVPCNFYVSCSKAYVILNQTRSRNFPVT